MFWGPQTKSVATHPYLLQKITTEGRPPRWGGGWIVSPGWLRSRSAEPTSHAERCFSVAETEGAGGPNPSGAVALCTRWQRHLVWGPFR